MCHFNLWHSVMVNNSYTEYLPFHFTGQQRLSNRHIVEKIHEGKILIWINFSFHILEGNIPCCLVSHNFVIKSFQIKVVISHKKARIFHGLLNASVIIVYIELKSCCCMVLLSTYKNYSSHVINNAFRNKTWNGVLWGFGVLNSASFGELALVIKAVSLLKQSQISDLWHKGWFA